MYKIIIEHKAAKQIESLPNEIIELVVEAIEKLKNNPRPHGVKKLIGDVGWRIRVRAYRVLYTIDDQQKISTIYRVKHRKESYR